jgi:hypothetical protein
MQLEMAFVMIECIYDEDDHADDDDSDGNYVKLASIKRGDALSGQWSAAASMQYARSQFRACVVAGELHVSGGHDQNEHLMSSVEKF